MKTKILIISLGLIIIIGAFLISNKTSYYDVQSIGNSNNIGCSEEAMQCPDGSYVGRSGPNCEFQACPMPVVIGGAPGDNGGIYACTMDAKMCPDGSYVGRTGPKCEFQACPSSGASGTVLAGKPNHAIGESLEYNGITITPISIKEDSRCRDGVQCIWAGRLIVKVRLENTTGTISGSGIPGPAVKKFFAEVDLVMGEPHDFAGKRVTLTEELDGKFTFEVK